MRPPTALPRSDDTDSADLAASIRRHGGLQPIVVRKADGAVIIGERRRRLLEKNPEAKIEVIEIDVDEIEALLIRFSEEASKTDIPALQRGNALLDLKTRLEVRTGGPVTAAVLGDQIGMAVSTVAHYLALAQLPEPVKALVEERPPGRGSAPAGTIGVGAARALSRTHLPDDEKIAVAKKIAQNQAPNSLHGTTEMLQFLENDASPTVRRHFIGDPGFSYEDARRTHRRENRPPKLEPEWPEEAFWTHVAQRLMVMRSGLTSIRDLVRTMPQGNQPRLREEITKIWEVCAQILDTIGQDTVKDAPESYRAQRTLLLEAAADVLEMER